MYILLQLWSYVLLLGVIEKIEEKTNWPLNWLFLIVFQRINISILIMNNGDNA